MATNHVQPGNTITLTAPTGGVSSGDGVLVGAFFGVAKYDASAGDPVEVDLVGVWDLPKAAGALSEGDVVYWDPTAGEVSDDDGGYFIGAVTQDALSADATARVRLNGIAIPGPTSP